MEILMPQNPSYASRGKSPGPARTAGRSAAIFAAWCLLLCLGWNAAKGQTVSREYPLKAVFLLNFAQFTDWPAKALTDTNAPFVIGVLGRDPFGSLLDETVHGENRNGHPIIVQRYPDLIDLRDCQVLFISESEARRLPKIMAVLHGKPVLTVTDMNSPAVADVNIRFVTQNNRIRFRINTDSLKDAGITVSSKLLRVAEIAPAENK